ncbi:hypothetical protein [Phyllobacterium sp. YR531]|uniref:hypothetical protein n=1 Tax=Phyllobacterium sp. YR531 TaxID=1144343 RepID=UPI00026F86F0|nr:hypothetical protein [Phyllobacterium sp. YR531]EJN04006.1 hypothetical protein PMI41_01641 [Phyllobacterium sp. YR531]
MGLFRNRKTGRRGAAPLLISIFWLISTLSATLGAGYFADRDANIASTDIGNPLKNETRIARDADSSTAPAQRPTRIAALETLHLKIKSGLRADSDPHDGLLSSIPAVFAVEKLVTTASSLGYRLIPTYNSSFSARAPPFVA